jgi:hypothetical protein
MKQRLTRIIVAAALALSALGIAAPSVSASCTGSTWLIYESPSYTANDSYFTGNSTGYELGRFCYGTNVPDLRAYWNCLAPQCDPSDATCANSLGLPLHNFANCVSSWKFIASSCHYGLRAYGNTNYGGSLLASYQGGTHSYAGGLGFEDNMESFKLTYSTTCPQGPE